MPLDESEVRAIAEYARVGLSDDEVVSMTADLNSIIETLQPIKEFDLDAVEPTFHPIGDLSNVMRDDVVGASLPQDVALNNSDSVADGCFELPTILGKGGDR